MNATDVTNAFSSSEIPEISEISDTLQTDERILAVAANPIAYAH